MCSANNSFRVRTFAKTTSLNIQFIRCIIFQVYEYLFLVNNLVASSRLSASRSFNTSSPYFDLPITIPSAQQLEVRSFRFQEFQLSLNF